MENNGIIIPSLAWPVIDKVYSNLYTAMQSAENDGIQPGRFVLIQYCDLVLAQSAKQILLQGNRPYPPFEEPNYEAIFYRACTDWLNNYNIDYEKYCYSKEYLILQKIAYYDEALNKYRFTYKEITYLNVPDTTPIDVSEYVNNRLSWKDYLD